MEPTHLIGSHIELVPLAPEHAEGLVRAYSPGTSDMFRSTAIEPTDLTAAKRYVEHNLDEQLRGLRMPFVVLERASGEIVGATHFLDIDADIPRLEIGSTWYAVRCRGTVVNPESKRLMLGYAFEQLDARVVYLRTSSFNERSQRAIAKLGASEDGILRRHAIQVDGRLRDTIQYSILAEDWPRIRDGLDARIARGGVEPTPGTPAADSLIVRAGTPSDAEAMLDYMQRNREFLQPFEPIRPASATHIDQVRDRLTVDEHERRITFVAMDGDTLVGQVSINNVVRGPFLSAHLGYSVDREWNGRGVATTLVGHAIAHAFGALGLHRLEAGTLPDNHASQRVLRKFGFRQIGVSRRHLQINGEYRDHVLFSLTKEDVSHGSG